MRSRAGASDGRVRLRAPLPMASIAQFSCSGFVARKLLLGACVAGVLVVLGVVGVDAAAAASWTAEPIPGPVVPSGGLSAVSCVLVRSCMAVGGGPDGPLAERWNGAVWTLQSLPGGVGGGLSEISCSSSTACAAVGAITTITRSGPARTSLASRWWSAGTAGAGLSNGSPFPPTRASRASRSEESRVDPGNSASRLDGLSVAAGRLARWWSGGTDHDGLCSALRPGICGLPAFTFMGCRARR